MRRGCSAVLFFVGGWMLASIATIGIVPESDDVPRWVLGAVFAVLAAPFLLAGTWMSPGRRAAELGLTLMIAAGVALFMVLTLFAITRDAALMAMMPDPIPTFDPTSPVMLVAILAMAGGGYALRRGGRDGDRPL